MNKTRTITTQAELHREFRRLLDADPDLRWIPTPPPPGEPSIQRLSLRLDNTLLVFRPFYERTPKKGLLSVVHLMVEEGKGVKGTESNPIDLLVTVRLTRRMIEWCRKQGLSAIDLNGRAYLRAPDLLVDRAPIPGRDFRHQVVARNIFTGKSERIVRTLLSDVNRTWRQKELVSRTDVSPGLVSRVTKHLMQEGYLMETGSKEYTLEGWDALLDDWAGQDSMERRVSIFRYSVFAGDATEWARNLREACAERSIQIGFTQWIAVWLGKPYTEPVVTTAYIDRLPDDELLDRLGYREVTDAGKVWLYMPNDEGVFRELREVDGLPLVTDAQIYVDLQRTGLRGPDQATALRESEEFCRKPL